VQFVRQTYTRNRLLAALEPDDLGLVSPHLEPITLRSQDVLTAPGQPIEYVYFFESGLSSEIAISPQGQRIEVGCLGREGMSGFCVVLGVDQSPHLSFAQVGGPAQRMKAGTLQHVMDASPSLRALLLRYIHVLMVQLAQTALADGRYTIDQRLARWLLLCHDRLETDELELTHEFLSLMLGVRRAGVTSAIHLLEGDHIIKATRGCIRILDRSKLEAAAGDSYGVPEAEYARLIG
jgi:CRP-like cAMP-binding protein